MGTITKGKLTSLKGMQTPRLVRWLGRATFTSLLLVPLILIFIPWTQTVHATGRAIAFNPIQRPQFIVSPIEGRVKKWYVVEGERVKTGQRIVEMVDNDPNLEQRLLDEERAILDRMRAAEGRVRDIESRIRNLKTSRDLALTIQNSIIRQEDARVQTIEQDQLEAKATLVAAEPNYLRQKELFENPRGGLSSKRDLEIAVQTLETARARLKSADARLKLGVAALTAAQDTLHKVDADTAAAIDSENASRGSAEADVAIIRREQAVISTRIARQRAQYVDAPCDGVIGRLLANAEQGGILVRPGERLAVLVPDIVDLTARYPRASSEIAGMLAGGGVLAGDKFLSAAELTDATAPGIVAELLLDGNDLPLIRTGDKVRLQFEGWPAVQFAGWPSVARGTFGGRVLLIDPGASDRGQIRILVKPDPEEPSWPTSEYLRQGIRAQGWVLLREVTLGWEFWRQLNGFPPTREAGESAKSAK